ncbi:MAG: B12-binding domain-containing radical SAM protein [Candidatus Omnitrophica bacterium]|nr:B12-binding domain-containing radical SAM protein [Candidatus Omnitrophota bacterium]
MDNQIILINPPSPFLINQKCFLPLGILYLAAVLEKNNIPVKVIDLAGAEDSLEPALDNYPGRPLYGITASTPQYPYAKKIKDIIKSRNRDARVIIGGSHPSSVPKQCLKDGFDCVVVGEGENAVLDIVKASREKKELPSLIRLPYIPVLDSIPFPARHLLPINSYGYDIGQEGRATTIITSRGCAFSCVFCSKDVWQQGARFHSVDYVIEELRSVISDYGIKHFLFLDDAINLKKERIHDLCLKLKPLRIKWRCYARADFNAKETLLAMKEAGCVEIGVGVESGSQKILDTVGKGSTVARNTSFINECKEAGITANAFIMIGLPGEDYQTVEATRRWMEEARPDKFGFNIFMPYAGTPVYNNPQNYDLLIYDIPQEHSWVKGRQGEYRCYVATSKLSSQEILRLFSELFEYYSRLLNWRPGVGELNRLIA